MGWSHFILCFILSSNYKCFYCFNIVYTNVIM